MKKYVFTIVIVVIAIAGFFAFRFIDNGSVKGSVTPVNAAVSAWAVSATDTFRANILQNGFLIPNVKKGSYTLMIQASPPYRNAVRNDVVVADGNVTDVGEIVLNQ